MNESIENIARINQEQPQADSVIRLFVIAHQDIYVDGLIRVISDHPAHRVVACSSPNGDCFERFCDTPAEILMIDHGVIEERLQHTSIDALFDDFLGTFPRLRIIVFGHEIPENAVRRLLRAGVHGFIDSNTTQDLLASAIQEVNDGGHWVGRNVLKQLIHSSVEMEQIIEQGIRDRIESIQDSLTKRETDVLQRVLEGMSTKEIASDLCLSEQSVKLHLGRLFKKFEVTNRSQLILMAFQRVCPANNMIKLFRKTLDKRRIATGKPPLIDDPLADPA
ncbi:MAG: LuxR C-terminal-related transcriptional regulator [bacterium]